MRVILRQAQAERRRPRSPSNAKVILAYADLGVSFPCAFRDRSETGGQLRLPTGAAVSSPLWIIEADAKVARSCSVVWRRYPNIGVQWAQSVDLAYPSAGDRLVGVTGMAKLRA